MPQGPWKVTTSRAHSQHLRTSSTTNSVCSHSLEHCAFGQDCIQGAGYDRGFWIGSFGVTGENATASAIMCRYHCYFFGGCGHQETLLVSFCSKAPPVANVVACAPSRPLASNSERTRCHGKTDSPLYRWSWSQAGALGGANDNHACVSQQSSVPFTPSPPLYASPLDSEGSASIIVQPDIDTPSLLTEHHSHSSPFSPSPSDMAGLPLFGLKHWMSGGSVPAPKQINAQVSCYVCIYQSSLHDSIADLRALQFQQQGQENHIYRRPNVPGIRERTDESCDLPLR